jgi:hypothetical protein
MKRQLVAAGLIAFALLFLTLTAFTMAAPNLQTVDSEPNNTFDDADLIPLNGSASATGILQYQQGSSIYTDVIDYYVAMSAQVGRQYRASLSTYGSQGGLTLKINLYDGNRDFLDDDNDIVQWTAYTTTYYVSVQALVASTTTLQSAQYTLSINRLGTTPTPTPSNTPTPTPPPSVSGADAYETHDTYTDNNSLAHAYPLPVVTSLKLSTYGGIANFHTRDIPNPPGRDRDWYRFWAKDGFWYQVATSALSGVDTRVVIYNSSGEQVTSNDDGGEGYGSEVNFEADYDGYYYIYVENKVNTTGTYDMTLEQIGEPVPGATSTPGPGPSSGADDCEDNGDFDKACVIAANDPKAYNFYPPYGGVDNDFYRLWVKPGFNYECSTSYLDAGVDPNMIVFTGPSWDNSIGGNDDVETGDLNSYFAFYATYEGWLYLLVGYGDRTPSDLDNSNYTLECKMSTPGTPTKTPAPTTGASTAVPTSMAPPTNTPPAGLTIRSLTTPTPVPGSGAPPEPQFVRIRVVVYYDANGDNQPGAGEGVEQISVRAYAANTNEQLAQQFTDEEGYLEFTVSAEGPVRVSVPYFGFSQLVSGEEATIRLRVPAPPLPGGEP